MEASWLHVELQPRLQAGDADPLVLHVTVEIGVLADLLSEVLGERVLPGEAVELRHRGDQQLRCLGVFGLQGQMDVVGEGVVLQARRAGDDDQREVTDGQAFHFRVEELLSYGQMVGDVGFDTAHVFRGTDDGDSVLEI